MTSECVRISGQLQAAFAGDPWHGPPLRDLVQDVSADQALRRPLPSAHSIWELVVHIDLYVNAAFEALQQGIPMPKWFGTEADWPEITHRTADNWKRVRDLLFQNAERLANAIEQCADARLWDKVPGREYDFYFLLHGVVQHSLYHGGQIALLKKAT
jgi:hypothetical protein